MKTSRQLEEEKRERDRESLKFGGGLPELNKLLQSLPNIVKQGANLGKEDWTFKGGRWVKTPEAIERDKKLQQLNVGRYPGSLDPKIRGEFASKGNVPKWTYENILRPTGETLTDAVNRITPGSELSAGGSYQSLYTTCHKRFEERDQI